MKDRKRGNETLSQRVEIPGIGEFEIVPAENATGCVDPRPVSQMPPSPQYIPSQYRVGAVRNPGASFGTAMSLIAAADVEPERAVETVAEWEESEGRTFTWHRADHGHVPGGNSGCGHIDKAADEKNESYYGPISNVVRKMREIVRGKAGAGAIAVKQANLTGPHKETGVLVVKSRNKTVVPSSENANLFRYDKTRHEERLERLGRYARGKGIQVKDEELKKASQRQTDATLGLLAEGLPVYEVELIEEKPRITLKGRVPKLK